MDFYRVEHHTIMSGRVVRYRLLGDGEDFEISASRDGVLIQGSCPHLTEADIEDVYTILKRATEVAHCMGQLRRSVGSEEYPVPFFFHADPACVVELHQAVFAGADKVIEQRERVS